MNSKHATVLQLYDEISVSQQRQIAIMDNEKEMTYAELTLLINNVSQYISENLNLRNKLIGIFAPRSAELIVCYLGILRSGNAFVPLDTNLPKLRLEGVINQSKLDYIISVEDSFVLDTTVPIIRYKDIHDFNGVNGLPPIGLSCDLSYVLFTSGTSGKPKGVCIENHSLLNFTYAMKDLMADFIGKKIAFHTSISFDISILESIVALCIGLKVVVIRENVKQNPRLFGKYLTDSKVNILQTTPSLLKNMLLSCNENFLADTSLLMIGGENFGYDVVEHAKSMMTGTIINMYGPTETTIWSFASVLNDQAYVHLGIPLLNTKYLIVDGDNTQASSGELFISGEGVARGYLYDVQTTKKFFRALDGDGDIYYQTGDLVRCLDNGDLVYLGRKDNQFKVNGVRIELEEIEHCIQQIEGINHAVVVPKEYIGGINFTAYIQSERDFMTLEIREHLEKHIHPSAIPSRFIFIDIMPLLPSGKADKNKLLGLDGMEITDSKEDRAEFDESVNKIRKIIEVNVAVQQSFSNHDNLLEIGMDSISFIKSVVDMEDEFGFTFDDNDLDINMFKTIDDFSMYIAEHVGKG